MRTIDNQQTWIALKFKNNDQWYAFDRAMGQLAKYSGEHRYGIYRPIKEAQSVAPYLSDKNSYELTYSSDEVLLDALGGGSYAKGQIVAMRRDARSAFLERHGEENISLYKEVYYKRVMGLLLSLANDSADRDETLKELKSYYPLDELSLFSEKPTLSDITQALLRIKLSLGGHKLHDQRTIWAHLGDAVNALKKWGDFDIIFHPRRYEWQEIHTDTTLYGYTEEQVKQALRYYETDPQNRYRLFSEKLKQGGYDSFIGEPQFREGKFDMLVPIEEYIECVKPSPGNVRAIAERAVPAEVSL